MSARRPRRAVRRGGGEQDGAGAEAPRSDVLPDRAAEDTEAAWGDTDEGSDERLRRDVPPHW